MYTPCDIKLKYKFSQCDTRNPASLCYSKARTGKKDLKIELWYAAKNSTYLISFSRNFPIGYMKDQEKFEDGI